MIRRWLLPVVVAGAVAWSLHTQRRYPWELAAIGGAAFGALLFIFQRTALEVRRAIERHRGGEDL